jgi:hypothetical protein
MSNVLQHGSAQEPAAFDIATLSKLSALDDPATKPLVGDLVTTLLSDRPAAMADRTFTSPARRP